MAPDEAAKLRLPASSGLGRAKHLPSPSSLASSLFASPEPSNVMARFGVIRFPGSCDEHDAWLAAKRFGDAEILWHGDRDLKGVDAVVVPGGFSYGDYLRVGAIARFSPVMEAVAEFAAAGGPVLGICNGFQVLCDGHLLPGALLPHTSLRFIARQVDVVVANSDTPFTRSCEQGATLSI